ncbi:peptidase M23 [Micromonospora sp. R77]|uniref:peptidase M23 n=1 Tax=Micromonospora sp. R77 TaxID=2925836 RepID=UPI001F61A53D|nr:peptidase M23 [Micromonospora sp. R77]MCI4065297.1 peptidase M23 [Micromonospora sp. R77]
MRDDGTLDDQRGLGGSADRSDDTQSTERSATASRLFPLGSLRTRLGGLANPLAARPGRTKVAAATGLVCCLGLVGFAQVGDAAVGGPPTADQRAELAQRAAPEVASRGEARQAPAPVVPSTSAPNPDVSPSATTKPKPKAKPKPKPRPKRIAPVAGLDQAQMDNAKAIVRAGRAMGVPRRGLVIAVATAMQESNLYNYASGVLPESQNYPHQAIGWDHDSVGLFQQRPSSGWGSVADLMQPAYATRQFLTALEEIPGWEDLPLTVAAQLVQVSAFPDAYAQHEWRAETVVAAILA